MEAVECGAASLSIILQYYGKYLPLEELRINCGVSRSGSNAFNLIKAAKSYDLLGEGKRLRFEDLFEIEYPVILFWEYKHFLVLEGFGKNKVYLNDPALGHRYISFEDFQKSYSGITLLFKPKDTFEKEGKPPSITQQIYTELKKIPNPVSFLIISGFLLLLPGFALPAFLMAFINTFFSQKIIAWRWDFLAVVFITFLFSFILNGLRKHFLNRLGVYLSSVFSSTFMWHLLKLPIRFYNQRFSGEIAYRQRLNDSVTSIFSNTLLSSAIDVCLIVFYALLMFIYDPTIAWIGLTAGICNFFVLGIIYRSRVNAYARLQQNTAKTVREGISGLQNIETIKAKGAESDFFTKWAASYTHTFNDIQEIGKKDVLLNSLPPFFQMFAASVLLGVGSLRIIEGELSIGMLMAMQILQTNFLQPISRFIGFNQLIQNMQIDFDRLNDVLKNPIDPSYEKKNVPLNKKWQGKLEFQNVTFTYDPTSSPLIKNLNFTILPGQKIALVGPTGSGKSTIAKLASRLLYPTSGQILLDDIPLEDIAKEDFCNAMATVDQDIFLFSGTIRENITLWNSKIPEEVLIRASQDACIHEEIVLRQNAYDSPLFEGGKNMSGGQRQRIEIARALLYNPPLLILDEAMSALDSKIEKEIADRITLRKCSTLIIAHRLSTIQDCHEILVLNQGKIVQRGTHEELKKTSEIYQELILSETFQCL